MFIRCTDLIFFDKYNSIARRKVLTYAAMSNLVSDDLGSVLLSSMQSAGFSRFEISTIQFKLSLFECTANEGLRERVRLLLENGPK